MPVPTPLRIEWLNGLIAGGTTSRHVVQAGEVAVSRTGISYDIQNISQKHIPSSLLFEHVKYVNGRWEPTHNIIGLDVYPQGALRPLMGGTIASISHDSRPDMVIVPGHYVTIISFQVAGTGDNFVDTEFLLVEFTVDENTPMYLSKAP